ncbi:MAG: hypothetical protein HY897_21830 [Deltaproteobacteria bacterium]|nr:hypothetical protein [Deltaproteobacteria bacterium]
MKLQQLVTFDGGEAKARAKAAQVLESFGFVPDGSEGSLFRRGSRAGSLLSGFSPDRWMAVAAIEVNPAAAGTLVGIHVDVNTTGQATTASEREFWETQVREIADSMTSDAVVPRSSARVLKKARKESIITLVLVSGLMLGCALFAGRRWMSLYAYVAGAAAGSLLGLVYMAAKLRLRLK